jgi:hypothetical protein
VLVVPSERDGHGNRRIALAVPPGFVPTSCDAPSGWRCSTTDKGLSWERVDGTGDPERFELTMQVASTPGTYLLPLSQTYDDGETRTFTGGPGTRFEAPRFTVAAAGGATTAPSASAIASRPTATPDSDLAALPAGRRLEPASSDDAPIAVVAVGFVALTVLGGAVLFVRQRQAR